VSLHRPATFSTAGARIAVHACISIDGTCGNQQTQVRWTFAGDWARLKRNIDVSRQCGDCSLCCKVMAVPELNKPKDTWCEKCTKTKGCSTYETRPQICRDFACMWLQEEWIPEALKPNRCHVVFSGARDGKGIVAHVDKLYPDAYKSPAVSMFIKQLAKQTAVYVAHGYKLIPEGALARKSLKEFIDGQSLRETFKSSS
jgi:hypothetical protein